MLRIIGIDPGSRKTGVGIIDYCSQSRKINLIYEKVIRLNLENSLSNRLAELSSKLEQIIKKYEPQYAAVEDVFMSEYPKAALILGQARGACLAALGLAQIEVAHMAARRVKQIISGSGQADKNQVGHMVQILLKLDKKPAEDACDALAVALSFAFSPEDLAGSRPKRASKKSKQEALKELAQSQGLYNI